MLVTALPQVMRSHLQFGAVLDNAVIRLEMQKSSLKLNNIFVTVLRGADCLEPCWSLDLEYFGIVLAVKSVTIMLERPVSGFVVGVFGVLALPRSLRLASSHFRCPHQTAPHSQHGGTDPALPFAGWGGWVDPEWEDALGRSRPALGPPRSAPVSL